MSPAEYNIEFQRGDDVYVEFAFSDPTGSPMDLTGHTASAKVRHSFDDTTIIATFTCALTTGNHGVSLTLPHTTSSTLALGNYRWDLRITETSTGKITTYLKGRCSVLGDVTR